MNDLRMRAGGCQRLGSFKVAVGAGGVKDQAGEPLVSPKRARSASLDCRSSCKPSRPAMHISAAATASPPSLRSWQARTRRVWMAGWSWRVHRGGLAGRERRHLAVKALAPPTGGSGYRPGGGKAPTR